MADIECDANMDTQPTNVDLRHLVKSGHDDWEISARVINSPLTLSLSHKGRGNAALPGDAYRWSH
ncbi:MAG TPA: hypothetical protein VN229_05450 [Terriglobales bacterium]|nr:hypothetical protein [Terriglobales bacterium]